MTFSTDHTPFCTHYRLDPMNPHVLRQYDFRKWPYHYVSRIHCDATWMISTNIRCSPVGINVLLSKSLFFTDSVPSQTGWNSYLLDHLDFFLLHLALFLFTLHPSLNCSLKQPNSLDPTQQFKLNAPKAIAMNGESHFLTFRPLTTLSSGFERLTLYSPKISSALRSYLPCSSIFCSSFLVFEHLPLFSPHFEHPLLMFPCRSGFRSSDLFLEYSSQRPLCYGFGSLPELRRDGILYSIQCAADFASVAHSSEIR